MRDGDNGLRRSPIPHFTTALCPGAEARMRAETTSARGEINGATTTLPPAGREVRARKRHRLAIFAGRARGERGHRAAAARVQSACARRLSELAPVDHGVLLVG